MVKVEDVKELRESLPEEQKDTFMQMYEDLRGISDQNQEGSTRTDNNDQKDVTTWECRSCGHEFDLEREKAPPYECKGCGKSSNKTLLECHDPPFKYFDLEGRKEFIPMDLANDILEDHNFATIEKTNQIYVYRDGVYQKTGDSFIEQEAQKRLGKESRKNRKREVVDYVKTATYTPPEEFDREKRKIVTENGILDLESRELKDHSPGEIHTIKLPIRYDPEANCPKIKQFIREIVKDEKDFRKVQELLGYTLIKENPLNKAFMGLGNGANGRSTLFRLFEKFLGEENTSSVKLLELTKNRFASSDLFGKIANFSGETSDGKIKNSHKFKEVCGEDKIRAEEKYQKAFKFINFATPWFASNDLPQTNDKTRSFYRRWVIIDFPYTFTSDPQELELDDHKRKDPSLPESIISKKELSGLLNFALDGLDRVLENHRFTGERSVNEKSELWEKESDPIANFIDSWCIEDEDTVIPKKILYNAYLKFCKENQLSHEQLGQFTKKLDSKGYPQSRKGQRGDRFFCYEGITIDDEEILKELVSIVSTDLVKTLRKFTGNLGKINKVLSEGRDTIDTRENQEKDLEDFDTKGSILEEIIQAHEKDSSDSQFIDELTKDLDYSREEIRSALDQLIDDGVLFQEERGITVLNK